MESLQEVKGEPRICYSNIYPEGFDPKQIVMVDEYGIEYAQNPWEINMSNINAIHILDIIGFSNRDSDGEPDYCGTISNLIEAEEKILAALADRHFAPEMDWGKPVTEENGEQGALIIDCGRRKEEKEMTNEMKLPGSISITRVNTNQGPNYIRIEVKDEVSRTNFCELKLSLEQFANALTGLRSKCELEVRPRFLGKKPEHKRELVFPVEPPTSATDGLDYNGRKKVRAQYSLAPFEVDGWMASFPDDFGNHHRGNDSKGYDTGFTRYVDATEEDIEALRNNWEYIEAVREAVRNNRIE
ncbi:unnamed protein product [Sphagnum tenellum]